MSQRKTSLAVGEYYHIYNRGNNKQKIFFDISDYIRFQELLYAVNTTKSITLRLIDKDERFLFDRGEQIVAIGAYCLMPNHFHILITPLIENGIQMFMQKLSTGYSMYFNKRYERTGSLFEGRFKSEHADNDEYLKYLFSYIHLNPIKLIQLNWKEKGILNTDNAFDYLQKYKYSSYIDRVPTGLTRGNRPESVILDIDFFPKYFNNEKSFLDDTTEWLTFNNEDAV